MKITKISNNPEGNFQLVNGDDINKMKNINTTI